MEKKRTLAGYGRPQLLSTTLMGSHIHANSGSFYCNPYREDETKLRNRNLKKRRFKCGLAKTSIG